MPRLKGNLTLVSAAGQGIDRAMVELFVKAGVEIRATDVNPKSHSDLTCHVEKLDFTNRAAVFNLIGSLRLDVLFSCAGVVHQGTVPSRTLFADSFEAARVKLFLRHKLKLYRLCAQLKHKLNPKNDIHKDVSCL